LKTCKIGEYCRITGKLSRYYYKDPYEWEAIETVEKLKAEPHAPKKMEKLCEGGELSPENSSKYG
jgi:hypothetical protein